jgi:hypothetical protein
VIITPRLVPAIHRALSERGIAASVALDVPDLPAPRLCATLSLDGDMLLVVETGRGHHQARLGAENVARLLAEHRASLESALAVLLEELRARQIALATEVRRVSQAMSIPQAMAVAGGFVPAGLEIAAGNIVPLADLATGVGQGIAAAAGLRVALRAVVRRVGRRMLSGLT